ncbi:MAG: type II toxin-antitoxin system HicB family antitoxin [Candidatus Lambdaproteobacteria bacterium]|nr:type II toxin-antitoxin system HicB family antitoxin [Candidatus Lambdaproteobacteria bacterium]
MRHVLLHPDETGGWVVECPSLPGCISQGETREEALINIKEAIELYVAVLKDEGEAIPVETFESILVAV